MIRVANRQRRPSWSGATLAAVAASIVLALGCGGAADQPSDSAPAAPAAQTAAVADPCQLVTQAEAETALGGTAAPGERPKEANFPPRLATCRYVAQRGQGVAVMTVMVRQSESDSESRIGFQQARDQFAGAETVDGVGDEAFWYANQLNVLVGRVYLNLTGDFDLPTARALAASAVERLQS